jgi:Ca-activated chloride channel family protein
VLAAPAWAEVEIEVVLDSSQFVWRRLPNGQYAFAAARTALSAWILSLPADDGLELGLRVAGGAIASTEFGACGDTRLLLPLAGADIRSWRQSLDTLRPRGTRPQVAAVVQAASDLSPNASHRRIILVTSGEDLCRGDRRAAAEALAAGIDLRIVGLGLDSDAIDRLAAAAPTRNAESARELLAALEWAAEDLVGGTRQGGSVRFDLRHAGRPIDGASARLVHAVTGSFHELEATEAWLAGEVPGGRYRLEVSHPELGVHEFEDVDIAPDRELSLRLDLDPPPITTLAVVPDEPSAGAEVMVLHWGAPSGDHSISLAPAESAADDWLARAPVTGETGSSTIQLPDDVEPLELRFHRTFAAGASRVIARTPVTPVEPQITLELETEFVTFDPVSVSWSGPDNPGDQLVIARPDDTAIGFASCQLTSGDSPTTLAAPGEVGTWELRYLSGLSGRILARKELTVTGFRVTLEAPDQVPAGLPFEANWEGPAFADDYLAVTPSGAEEGSYLILHFALNGSPARFTAPREPGVYELRYVDGRTNSTLESVEFEVVAIPIRLDAPATARAGTRFEIDWAGPDGIGDFVAIARPGTAATRHLDWFFTSIGSPATLGAPFQPGDYELRYVSGADHQILASIPIVIE